jgi:hypothetical protein
MAISQQVPQGNLSRLSVALVVTNHPGLNITPPFLGREAIRLAIEGMATARVPTMTGLVTSPEPYQLVTATCHLLKTQALALAWQDRYNTDTRIGPYKVFPDLEPSEGGIRPYQIHNGMIMGVRELNFSGEDAGWVVSLSGYIVINQNLWQAA